MDNMLLEDEQFDWLLEWYKIYKCINMRRSSKVNASVAMKDVDSMSTNECSISKAELGFIGVARQESNDSGENNICSMRSSHRFADVSSEQLLTTDRSVVEGHVGCDPDMNGYTMNRTEMFSIANNDSFPHTLIAESCRNIDIFSDENVPAVSNQNYTSFEDEYQYFVHQYTFEDYLNELSVALGDQSNNEVLASPVEPIFYPNLDETCEHKHELDAVHDFEQSRQYTLQELFNEYDRLVQNSTFAVESSVTQSEVLQVGYGDWNNACDANTSQNLRYANSQCNFTDPMMSSVNTISSLPCADSRQVDFRNEFDCCETESQGRAISGQCAPSPSQAWCLYPSGSFINDIPNNGMAMSSLSLTRSSQSFGWPYCEAKG